MKIIWIGDLWKSFEFLEIILANLNDPVLKGHPREEQWSVAYFCLSILIWRTFFEWSKNIWTLQKWLICCPSLFWTLETQSKSLKNLQNLAFQKIKANPFSKVCPNYELKRKVLFKLSPQNFTMCMCTLWIWIWMWNKQAS